MPQDVRNHLAHEFFRLVSTLTHNLCNFIPENSLSSSQFKGTVTVVSRAYATLYVIAIASARRPISTNCLECIERPIKPPDSKVEGWR
jgi:hypothetical protein